MLKPADSLILSHCRELSCLISQGTAISTAELECNDACPDCRNFGFIIESNHPENINVHKAIVDAGIGVPEIQGQLASRFRLVHECD